MTIGPLSSPEATMRLIALPNCARSPYASQHTRAGRPSHGRYFSARRIHRASVSSFGNSRRTTLSVLMMSSGLPARLVCHNVRPDLALHQFGMDLGTIPDEADRQRRPARLCFEGHLQAFVELEDDPIAISVRHAPPNPGLLDLDVEAHAFVHLDRERLRASHAAHAARQDESAFQRAAEMLPRTRRERLVRPLDDPLRSDV